MNEASFTSKDSAKSSGKCMMNRREFLTYSGCAAIAVSTISVSLFAGTARAETREATVKSYPRKKIASLSSLKDHQPQFFGYPDDGPYAKGLIVKMGGVKAGGGVGSSQDIVAFSHTCTHQGGPLHNGYKHEGDERILGQCPLHLTTYDLRRHGIVVSGQAYQSLPQVMLEIDGDDIYAVAVMGLLFGRQQNISA